jgi:ligand-binding SRPBCC domain-containing protein
MLTHSIKAVQKIPVSLQQAWDFFSDPSNLQAITPEDVDFKTITDLQGVKMHEGQIIEYKIKPLLGISFYWMTEITLVKDKELFIDEQRKGPYSLWHHEHHFKSIDGGVEMMDSVQYKNPLGPLGSLANVLFVKRKLKHVFKFRFKKVEELFGEWPGGQEFGVLIG